MHRPSDAYDRDFALHMPVGEVGALRVRPPVRISEDALLELCARNRDLRIEQDANGDLIVMSPSGSETSRRNASITAALLFWAQRDGTGVAFDSNGGFILQSGAMRAADAAWVRRERWEALTKEERAKFAHLCPDFVIELKSPSDTLDTLHEKMREWIANGARLGWLVDLDDRRVWIYDGTREPRVVEGEPRVRAESVVPGFEIDLVAIG